MLREIELGKLLPNSYNPRKRMAKKHLKRLEDSLEKDGQIQSLMVRPQNDDGTIHDGYNEVVTGMRRYRSLKNTQNDSFKVVCTVREMDDKTAMMLSFKENKIREEMNPIDEAGYYFNMLGLKEEQLYIQGETGPTKVNIDNINCLPSITHPAVKQLSDEINVSARIIADRITLLALPDELQELIARTYLDELKDKDGKIVETEMSAYKGLQIARLRLIEDKEKAHQLMIETWNKYKYEDYKSIGEKVTKILEAYKEAAEKILKALKTVEENFKKRTDELDIWITKDISKALGGTSKKSIFKELPEELLEEGAISIPKISEKSEDENIGIYATYIDDLLGELILDLTRNRLLDDKKDEIDVWISKLETGKRDIDQDVCVYCRSHVSENEIQDYINGLVDRTEEVDEKIKAKDSVRGDVEKLQRELRNLLRRYNDVKGTYATYLDKLLETNKFTKEQYDEKLKKFNLVG